MYATVRRNVPPGLSRAVCRGLPAPVDVCPSSVLRVRAGWARIANGYPERAHMTEGIAAVHPRLDTIE
ncbi:hypothetical protein [Mycobacterium decipiens]|uniref:hypothetical protein n=1 Tax=Mycobacterium decipiens TaxID=1430326 RepID=UPI000A17025C|nr:hypothetical protein [Mycobacterium decipiens]